MPRNKKEEKVLVHSTIPKERKDEDSYSELSEWWDRFDEYYGTKWEGKKECQK